MIGFTINTITIAIIVTISTAKPFANTISFLSYMLSITIKD